jgi:hypothetical protein
LASANGAGAAGLLETAAVTAARGLTRGSSIIEKVDPMSNPPITDVHGAYDDLSRLLAVIADPVQTKQRLDELIAQEKATQERIAALNEMAADTRRLHSAAQATKIVSDRRATALDARESELSDREKRIEQAEEKVTAASLQKRENLVSDREQKVEREEKRLTTVKSELDGKHAKVKNLAATL